MPCERQTSLHPWNNQTKIRLEVWLCGITLVLMVIAMDHLALVELGPLSRRAGQSCRIIIFTGLAFLIPHQSNRVATIASAEFVVNVLIVERESAGNEDIRCNFIRGKSGTKTAIHGIDAHFRWLFSDRYFCSLDPDNSSLDREIQFFVAITGLNLAQHNTGCSREKMALNYVSQVISVFADFQWSLFLVLCFDLLPFRLYDPTSISW